MRWKCASLVAAGSDSNGMWLSKFSVGPRAMEFAVLFLLGYMCFNISLNQTSYLWHSPGTRDLVQTLKMKLWREASGGNASALQDLSRSAHQRVIFPGSLWKLLLANNLNLSKPASADHPHHVMDITSSSLHPALVGAEAAMKNYSLFDIQLPPSVNSSRRLNTAGKRSRVAIVIPYRNRAQQLATFIPRLTQFLYKQNIDFHFIVIEQLGRAKFNRGLLMNIGFLEAERLASTQLQDVVRPFDCIALHDVDMIPVHGGNLYDCLSKRYGGVATQLSTAIDMYNWKLPLNGEGGVLLLPWVVYLRANGFNNRFFGWGGEDNDFAYRLKVTGNPLRQQEPAVGRYATLKDGHFRSPGLADNRLDLLEHSNEMMGEGLSTIKFSVVQRRGSGPRVHTITVDTWPHEDPDVEIPTSQTKAPQA